MTQIIKAITLLVSLFLCGNLMMATAQIKSAKIRPSIHHIIAILKKEDEVHLGNAVGYAGKKETNNKYYKLYLKLKAKATNEELDALTSDTCKPIVIYSFAILHSRNYIKLKAIFLEHLNDSIFFWTAGGCTGIIDRVNWYMLRRLQPSDKDNSSQHLTADLYNTCCALLKKQDAAFFYYPAE